MNTMKKILTLAAVSAGIFVISSCCRTTDIAGEWTVNEVNGETLPVLLEGQKVPFLSFDPAEGKLHGNTGVNIINSTYTIKGNKLELGPAMSTMMAGPQEWMEAESEILAALDNARTVKSVDETTIELCDSTGTAVLSLVRK